MLFFIAKEIIAKILSLIEMSSFIASFSSLAIDTLTL